MKKSYFWMTAVVIEIIGIVLQCKIIYNWGIIRDEYNMGVLENDAVSTAMYSDWALLVLLVLLFGISLIQLLAKSKSSF